MTILNVHLEKERALVAVNSEGIRIDGSSTSYACKLHALPLQNAVLALRGHVSMGAGIYLDCCSSFADFDELVALFPKLVERRHQMLKDEVEQAGVQVDLGAQVVLIGWSSRWKQIVGLWCELSDELKVTKLEGSFVGPWPDHWPPRPHEWPSTVAEMTEVAREQARLAEQHHPGNAWHGNLLIAELTPESIAFRSVREFCE